MCVTEKERQRCETGGERVEKAGIQTGVVERGVGQKLQRPAAGCRQRRIKQRRRRRRPGWGKTRALSARVCALFCLLSLAAICYPGQHDASSTTTRPCAAAPSSRRRACRAQSCVCCLLMWLLMWLWVLCLLLYLCAGCQLCAAECRGRRADLGDGGATRLRGAKQQGSSSCSSSSSSSSSRKGGRECRSAAAHGSSSTSLRSAARATASNAAATLSPSLALVSKCGRSPLAAHHCLARFSETARDPEAAASSILLPSTTKGKFSGSRGCACRCILGFDVVGLLFVLLGASLVVVVRGWAGGLHHPQIATVPRSPPSRSHLQQELVAPAVERLERARARDVVREHAAVGAAVEGDAQRLEALLAGGVPDLGRFWLAVMVGVV